MMQTNATPDTAENTIQPITKLKPDSAINTAIPVNLRNITQTLHHHKAQIWKHSWVWCLVLPFILSCCYFGFIASDRYVAEAKVIIKQAENGGKGSFDIPLLGSSSSTGKQDAYLVRDFILSLDMLNQLDTTLALRAHYQNKDADLLSRLWESDPQEEFLNYYRKHLTISYDELSGVLAIQAQAFNPEFAQKIVQTILQQSENYINQINIQLAKEQMRLFQVELERASEHLRQSKQQMLGFQDQYQLFSPEQESGAKLTMVNELEAELTHLRAELNNLRAYMNDTAPDILALKAKIRALENQLQIERRKLVGDGNNTFSDVNARYADLMLDLEFATDLYKTALVSLEKARVEAYQKLKHLVVVDSPSLAEEAKFPRRIYNLASILVILLLLYGTLQITVATIREHRDV